MQRWSNVAPAISAGTFDPQGSTRFTISPDDAIASAGSCFAARVAERLRKRASNYLSVEPHPAWMADDVAESYGYLPFAARHGLIFTTLQLVQLFDRAFEHFDPVERAWTREAGFVDPFRPRISPEPYVSVDAAVADRAHHLAAMRGLFRTVDVFIFTMGLTEVYRDRRDGAAYPICPGLAGGTFDPSIHEFVNLSFNENYRHLERFIVQLRKINPTVRIVLSVSPVPIGATIEPQHVVRSATYTKSVLRSVAEEIHRAYDFVDYFAGYEMVSQASIYRDDFTADRRHVKPEAADRVIDVFCSYYLVDSPKASREVFVPVPLDNVLPCDEDLFAR